MSTYAPEAERDVVDYSSGWVERKAGPREWHQAEADVAEEAVASLGAISKLWSQGLSFDPHFVRQVGGWTPGSAHTPWVEDRLNENVVERFERLRADWHQATWSMSSLTSMVMHPAYQAIIGLGPQVVPILIEDLRSEPEHWFWALRAIVGDDHGHGATTLREAADRWISWFEGQQ